MNLVSLSAATVVTVLVAAVFFSPAVQALNTYSIDLEKGSTQYLLISDGSQTGLDLSSAFTLEAWVKFESGHNAGTSAIVSKYNAYANDRGYSFYVEEAGGNRVLALAASSNGTSFDSSYVTWTPSADTWYHVAVTYSSGTVKFFVNGAQVGATDSNSVTSVRNSTADFQVGAMNAADTDSLFDGKIDDVRVWNRARTATEIADDMDTELFGNESGLVSYWKLNNDLTDISTNANTLTNNNTAVFSSDAGFAGFSSAVLAVRKSADESIASSEVLQDDDDLQLSLAANTTYIIDGLVMVSTTSGTPDLDMAFVGQTGSDLRLSYTTDAGNEVLIGSGGESGHINLAADVPLAIHVKGTVEVGSASGQLKLKWAQGTSNASAVKVLEGSYLEARAL